MSSECPIEVRGHVEGDLSAPALAVSPSGAVHGRVKVGEMRSQGELAGEFDADVVQLSGVVKDNTVIRAKSLEVKLAPPNGKMQVIFGECELEVGSEHVEKPMVSEPLDKPAGMLLSDRPKPPLSTRIASDAPAPPALSDDAKCTGRRRRALRIRPPEKQHDT